MTPDQARDLLDGTTPGPWKWVSGKDDNIEYEALRGPDGANALRTQDAEMYASWIHGTDADKALAAHAPDMARTIAAMQPKYRAEYQTVGGHWFPTDHCRSYRDTWGTKQKAERHADEWKADGYPTRIIRRYFTAPEVIA